MSQLKAKDIELQKKTEETKREKNKELSQLTTANEQLN